MGRRDRPLKRLKGGTVSSKKHRFESFNQRIAKLHIDPVRRARHQDIDKANLSSTASYFGSGLEKWRDLNLSEDFVAFVQEVEPLCDSLAQIVHYHQQIMDILVKYIERRDALSLEPLLGLLSNLAHDLGTKFEMHFSRAVTLVTSLAAKHPDVEVIEWSFTCLAWLFKYLSRLLVPDLRPLYDIISPLIGKEPQKLHITRFAAEAMSFLIRKAALGYQSNRLPLDTIISHIFSDLNATRDQDTRLYQYGLMTLFADSIKGINTKIHSCGLTIYCCLLDLMIDQNTIASPDWKAIVHGVTINLIHHTDGQTFQPVLNLIYDRIEKLTHSVKPHLVSIYGELLFIVAVVRKGSRIQESKPMVDSLVLLVAQLSKTDASVPAQDLEIIAKATAVIFQYSPLDLVIPHFGLTIGLITSKSQCDTFLSFCNYFCDLGRDRFQSLLAPYFYRLCFLAHD